MVFGGRRRRKRGDLVERGDLGEKYRHHRRLLLLGFVWGCQWCCWSFLLLGGLFLQEKG